jgi:hypothetical protein
MNLFILKNKLFKFNLLVGKFEDVNIEESKFK